MADGSNGTVRVEQDGTTRILIMSYGAVNTIVLGIRAGLMQALLDAELDQATESVVVIGAGGNFCGGADLDEFARGTAMTPPSLHGHITPFIEAMTKPVVAAIEGFALGGGLELALGCHARVAGDSARVGLPETNFGLIPGAGGTVRLPRTVGMETAARMIVAAEIVPARDLTDGLLFDEITSDDVRAAAIAQARNLATKAAPLPLLRNESVAPFDASAIDALRNLPRPSQRATRLAIASVLRAAEMPFDQAASDEYADFSGLLMGDESAALRHVFLAARAAQKVPGLPAAQRPRNINRVGIAGTGTLADRLIQGGTRAGYDMAHDGEPPAPGWDGELTERPALTTCDAVFEVAPTTAEATAPSGHVRLHSFGPPQVVDVVHDDGTDPGSLLAAMQFTRRAGMTPVCVRPGPRLLVARLAIPYLEQAVVLASEGIAPGRIDRALEGFGMRHGPFAAMDAIGREALLREHPAAEGWGTPRTAGCDGNSTLNDTAIAQRCILALVNEGMRALGDGTVQRPGDIDLAMVEALGFPAAKGGPIFWAETRGLPLTLVDISRLHEETGDPFWTPAATLRDRATGGHSA